MLPSKWQVRPKMMKREEQCFRFLTSLVNTCFGLLSRRGINTNWILLTKIIFYLWNKEKRRRRKKAIIFVSTSKVSSKEKSIMSLNKSKEKV